MKTLEYIIKDEAGVHARPAGILVNACKEFESKIMLAKDGKPFADAKRLFVVMAQCIKCGEKITMTFEGCDEEAAFNKISEVLKNEMIKC